MPGPQWSSRISSSATATLTAVDGVELQPHRRARCWPCSAPTAPARRRPSRCSRATGEPPPGRVRVLGHDPAAEHDRGRRPDRRDAPGGRRLPRHPSARDARGCWPPCTTTPSTRRPPAAGWGSTTRPDHDVAPAQRRRAAAAQPGHGPRRPARGRVPRRTHRRGRRAGPPGHPRRSSASWPTTAWPSCCAPTSSTRPRRWPTGSSSSTGAGWSAPAPSPSSEPAPAARSASRPTPEIDVDGLGRAPRWRRSSRCRSGEYVIHGQRRPARWRPS